MKQKLKRYFAGLAVFAGSLVLGQPANAADVRVRLFTYSSPQSVTLTATAGSARYRPCRNCAEVSLSRAVDVRADRNRVIIGSGPPVAGDVVVSGRFNVAASGTRFLVDGRLEISGDRNVLRLILNLPLEDYVAAVLAGEGGGLRQPEARKALSVAIRTYAVRNRGRHAKDSPSHPFDFCDTTHCQDLRISVRNNAAREAALATEGEILWFHGEPAATYYHRSCGGTTENVRYVWPEERAPYLRQLTDTFCQTNSWSSRVNRLDFLRALRNAGIPTPGDRAEVRIEQRSPSGRVLTVAVDGTRMSGQEFVRAMGLTLGWRVFRSTLFQIQEGGGSLFVTGRGDGHGVGLCQTGAEARAAAGHSYENILSFYYPGTEIGVNARGFRWRKMPGARVDVYSTRGVQDQPVVAVADTALARAEQATRFRLDGRPSVRVYPTVAAYRDATGEPGWVAASTVGSVIRLQPAATLRAGGILEATLLHELLHVLVDSRARPSLPVWFREGLVLYLAEPGRPASTRQAPWEAGIARPSSEAEMRRAYEAARSRVRRLADRYGRNQVLSWVTNGLPANLQE